MSGSPFGIFERQSAKQQTKAMREATDLEYDAAMAALDFQKEMLQQARDDFAPYLSAGGEGLEQLQNTMSDYVQQVVVPTAQRYGAFQHGELPAANWRIDPLTGQRQMVGEPRQPRTTAPTGMPDLSTAALADRPTDAPAIAHPGGGRPGGLGRRMPAIGDTGLAQMRAPGAALGAVPQEGIPIPAAPQPVPSGPSEQQLAAGGVLAPAVPDFQRPMDLEQYAFRPDAPMPDAPQLEQQIDYQFDTNDPVYQQKLYEKNQQIDKFLARQGLQGSSAGESFRQQEINKLLAEEDQRQYSRALTQAGFKREAQTAQYGMGTDVSREQYRRQLGESELGYGRAAAERDYMTQSDLQRFGLEASRGEMLYGRITGQEADLFQRMTTAQMMEDERRRQELASQYGIARDIHGLQYAGSLDLAKMGAGAAGAAGGQSMLAGQLAGQQYGAAGEAAAQGALGQAAVWAQYTQGMGSQMGQVGSAIGRHFQNQQFNQSSVSPSAFRRAPAPTTGANAPGGYGTSTYNLDYGSSAPAAAPPPSYE